MTPGYFFSEFFEKNATQALAHYRSLAARDNGMKTLTLNAQEETLIYLALKKYIGELERSDALLADYSECLETRAFTRKQIHAAHNLAAKLEGTLPSSAR